MRCWPRVERMAETSTLLTFDRWHALCLALPRAKVLRHSYLVGSGKAFAVWATNGDQVGPHLRSNDASVRADARARPSTLQIPTIELKNNFIYLNPHSDWSVDELRGLLEKSHALAVRKDGGIKRGDDYRDLYLAVRKALAATPPALRPPPPHHAGGPAAKILKREAEFAQGLAGWAVKQLKPFVPEAERARYAELEALLADASATHFYPGFEAENVSLATQALKAAVRARARNLSAPSHAADGVMCVHSHLLKHDPVKLTAWVAALDEQVLIAEFVAIADAHTNRPAQHCERVLWRGADAKGNAGRWVARVATGHYALIQKVGKRWEWLEGARDDVLASVPDADFAEATALVVARDTPGVFGLPDF